MVFSKCHPNKRREAHGLCQNCYKRNTYDPKKASIVNRKNGMKSRYGLTFEQYQQRVLDQNGLCAICGKQPDKLHIDHDHFTKVVRGLLCLTCNSHLGWYEKHKDRAENYLRRE